LMFPVAALFGWAITRASARHSVPEEAATA